MHGPLHASGPGRIDGNIKGEISIAGKLIIGKEAEIRGDVYAGGLELYGKVYGDIFCRNKAVVYNTAFVEGNVTASIIDVKEGATINGVITKKADLAAEPAAESIVEEIPPVVPEAGPLVAEEPPVPEKSTDQDRDATAWF